MSSIWIENSRIRKRISRLGHSGFHLARGGARWHSQDPKKQRESKFKKNVMDYWDYPDLVTGC